MKQLIAMGTIIIFLYVNCSVIPRSGRDGILFSCKATYKNGSLDLAKGQKGILLFSDDSIQFKYMQKILNIPYDDISSIEENRDKKTIFPVSQELFGRYHPKAKLDPSLGGVLLITVAVIALVIGTNLLIGTSEHYVNFTVYADIMEEDDWVTFKVKKDDYNKFLPILKQKTGMDDF